jgi:replicative DNA helicase
MIPTHNSTLALDIARAAAVRNGLTTVIFSLEMGRNEITMRLLSAEARVPLHTMRTGQMSDDDWARLARRMGEVAEAPLFIDDSPNMSMMEIRAKCRRLKQRHDLRIVIVDYMQLMSTPKRVESRQQEVSEMSRALKLLAKELDVPVIAISQLNRGPEQRNDKRPLLSDLRESGCLTAETRILRADTGTEVSLGDLLASGERDVPVWSFDEQLRLMPATMTHVFPNGVKEVFRVRLTSGREVDATANHPFLTYDGWKALRQLTPGSRIAVPRKVPDPLVNHQLLEPEIILFAHLISPRLHAVGNTYGRPQWTLDVRGADDQRRFLNEIGIHGERERNVRQALKRLDAMTAVGRFDTVPANARERVRHVNDRDMVGSKMQARVGTESRGDMNPLINPSRKRLRRIAAVPGDAELEMLATNDVHWDTIKSVESIGDKPVYDATVPGNHNFVANGIAVHNSIEQDSDVVILLHREDAYERESPRAGEADLIVAKHRNGPTATLTVAFQGHYSRFVDMAPG